MAGGLGSVGVEGVDVANGGVRVRLVRPRSEAVCEVVREIG